MPVLMAYEYVFPGFEIVLGESDDLMVKSEFVPGLKGGIWNLWFNVTLNDDPNSWDDEIRALNQMQSQLGPLTEDVRLIRAQMAEFCRRHPTFPTSIDTLVSQIAIQRFTQPLKLGCEGRGLLEALGYHDLAHETRFRGVILSTFRHSLLRWLTDTEPETPGDLMVYGFLGDHTPEKNQVVDRLVELIEEGPPTAVALRTLALEECRKKNVTPFWPNCFNSACWPDGVKWNGRLCCYFKFLQASLLCVGMNGTEQAMRNRFHRFIEEHILAYAWGLNTWLNQDLMVGPSWIDEYQFVSHERAQRITSYIHSTLKEQQTVKMWLVGCLLKTLKDNQRKQNQGELIDAYPDATSWFNGLHE
ncbi:MAG: hypothetical protein ACFFCO_05405 [Promethearchaeota archaeon]